MSRAYRVAVKGGFERTVHIDDGVQAPLELLPILPQQRMAEILEAELTKRGFEKDERGDERVMRRRDGETTIEVDLDTSTVTVRQESELELDIRRERTTAVVSTADVKARERELQKELQEDMEKEAKDAIEEARKKTTAALEAALRDVRKELDDIANKVTGEALKEKARTMGEIEEMLEDAETGALTIKVRL